jgi:uncharacterized repeat protein (TIGR01451 family)
MFRRIIYLVTILITFPISGRGQAQNSPSLLPEAKKILAGIRLLSSDLSGVVLELDVPEYELVSEIHEAGHSQQILLDGASKTTEVGKPELPVYRALIGLPAGAQVNLQIVTDISENLSGQYNISPVPRADFIQFDAKTGEYVYERDTDSYSMDTLYPSVPVQIVEDAWLRDQRVVSIELYPFQYNPLRSSIHWHRQLIVQVQFMGDNSTQLPVYAGTNNIDAFDSVLQEFVINYDVARAWRVIPSTEIFHPEITEQTSNASDYDPVFLGPRYKVVVDYDGLYRLSYNELQLSQPLESNIINTFHMYNQGRDVAIYVDDDDGDGFFENADSIYFIGEQFRGDYMAQRYSAESTQWMTFTEQLTNGALVPWHPEFDHFMLEKYTDQNVYWLTVGGVGGPFMAEVNGDPSGSTDPIPATYKKTVHAEQENRHWETTFTSTDSWFWEYVTDFLTHTYTTTLTAVAPGDNYAVIRAEMASYTNDATHSPDHHTRFTINNLASPLDEALWDGKSRYRFESQIPQTDLIDGVNELKFVHINDAYSSPYTAFDFFEVDYARLFRAEQNKLRFVGETAGTWRYRAGGFTNSAITVYDVTDPLSPVYITNPSVIYSSGTYTVTFLATHEADERYFIAGGYETPNNLTYYQPPDFSSVIEGVDYLIISHSDFITTAQTLLDYRASQGLSTMIVDLDDLYSEFFDGIFHPLAIKYFLAYTFSHWQNPPTYVILIGDGTWNMKNNNPARYGFTTTYMPPNLSWVDPWLGETDSSNLLANVVGDDILPDVLISRMPVSSSTELNNIISKITSYEKSSPETWQRNMLFIADDTPDQAGDFVEQSETIINEFVRSGYSPLRIYLDDYKDYGLCGTQPFPLGPTCPAVNHAITETVSTTGTLFVNYTGHGGASYWTSDTILLYQRESPSISNDYDINDIATMQNGSMLPVVVSMTCWDGYWIYPIGVATQPSLSELWLNTGERGAVAIFSAGGLGVETGHLTLQEGFYESVFDNGNWNLGLATLAAKLKVYQSGGNFELINTYLTYGDPALHILSPYQVELTPETSEAMALPGTSVTYTFTVTNTGKITDTFALSLTDSAWPASLPTTIGPLPTGQSQSFDVIINIPANVGGGVMDTSTLVVTSLGDRSRTDMATLTTHVQILYLPLLQKE